MQILDGTLAVEVIKGSRGDFCVGTLKTSIGEFKIKDAALEQFERGSYQGRFTIEKIYIESTRWQVHRFDLIATWLRVFADRDKVG